MDLDGRRVLITGGGAGMGRFMAATFARAGAAVHIADIDVAALDDARGAIPGLTGSTTDITDEDAVEQLVADAVAAMGGLDTLINNAGIPGPTAAVEDVDPADWRRTLDVDITGMFLVTRATVPHLKAAKGGSVLNMSSTAGRMGFSHRSPYAAAKHAVVGFTRSISIELGPFDINVNCIQPGPVDSPLQGKVLAAVAQRKGITSEQALADRMAPVSMTRQVSQQEIADIALFLCSSTGHMISGQSIAVDGDQTALV
jgi:NAD(P)-dependent dehydrogenase (short-subunit alcohol dehydrogenase family)